MKTPVLLLTKPKEFISLVIFKRVFTETLISFKRNRVVVIDNKIVGNCPMSVRDNNVNER